MQAIPLLMSMSAATPADDSRSDQNESALGFPFCIKNTFIDVFNDFGISMMPRRSASAPATPRGSCKALSTFAVHSSQQVTSPSAWSDASTMAEVDSQAELSDDSCGESVVSDFGSVQLTLATLLPPPPETPSRTKLNTGAKAWAPAYRDRGASRMPGDVKSQFAEISAAAQAALMGCTDVQHVSSIQRDDNWFLEASSQETSLQRAHSNLSAAKQAMLCAAQGSSKIRIVGYERTPFAPHSAGFGFSARFACVDDDACVCWSLMAKGACRRGCSCRWQHPTWMVSMNVTMKV